MIVKGRNGRAWRWCAAALLCGAIQLASASSAYAFWDWLDNLSGPGKFMGYRFEFRLACFGEESEAKRLIDLLTTANSLTVKAVYGDAGSRAANLDTAKSSWYTVFAALHQAQLTFPVIDQKTLHDNEAMFSTRWSDLVTKTDVATSIDEVRMVNDLVTPSISEVVRGTVSVSSTGVVLSACSIDKKRRMSIEVGLSVLHADPNPLYADNNQIWLTTVIPSFSFRVFTDPRFDVVDAGVGAGGYWFTSRGFDSFTGLVIQPARFDFHAPTLWSSYGLTSGGWKTLGSLAAIPNFRFGWTVFPSGFSADAFAGIGDKHARLPAEMVPSWSVFLNFEPLVRSAAILKTSKQP